MPGVEPCHPLPPNGSRLLGMKWQERWKRKEEGGMLGGGSSSLQQELGWAQRSHGWSKFYHRSLCPPLTLLDSALPFFHSLLLQGLQSPPKYSLCRRPGFSRHPPHSLAGSEYHSSQGSSLRTNEATSVDKSEGGQKRVLLSHTIHLSLSPIQIHLCSTSMICGYIILVTFDLARYR